MRFINDYLGFATKFKVLIENNPLLNSNEATKNLLVRFQKRDNEHKLYWSDIEDAPFFSSGPIEFCNGEKRIGYNETIINETRLDETEQYALIFHEIGHFLYPRQTQDKTSRIKIELLCDEFSRQILGSSVVINALEKIYPFVAEDKVADIMERILILKNKE